MKEQEQNVGRTNRLGELWVERKLHDMKTITTAGIPRPQLDAHITVAIARHNSGAFVHDRAAPAAQPGLKARLQDAVTQEGQRALLLGAGRTVCPLQNSPGALVQGCIKAVREHRFSNPTSSWHPRHVKLLFHEALTPDEEVLNAAEPLQPAVPGAAPAMHPVLFYTRAECNGTTVLSRTYPRTIKNNSTWASLPFRTNTDIVVIWAGHIQFFVRLEHPKQPGVFLRLAVTRMFKTRPTSHPFCFEATGLAKTPAAQVPGAEVQPGAEAGAEQLAQGATGAGASGSGAGDARTGGLIGTAAGRSQKRPAQVAAGENVVLGSTRKSARLAAPSSQRQAAQPAPAAAQPQPPPPPLGGMHKGYGDQHWYMYDASRIHNVFVSSFPDGSTVYQHLDADSRRAMRLVCKQLRAAMDDAVSGLSIDSIDRDGLDEVLQRLARTALRPTKLYLEISSETSHRPTLLAVALLAQELVPILHGVQGLTLLSALPLSAALVISSTMPQLRSLDVDCHMDVSVCRAWQRLPHLSSLTLLLTPASDAAADTPLLKGLEHITSLRSLDLTDSQGMVDEGSLAACTQLTALCGLRWFPALTQLIQLQQLYIYGLLSSDSLPLFATLPQLADLRLQSCPLQPSSQLSRFLFQNLTSLTVYSIHSRDLAALDCPQLQTLTLSELQVDCAASLRACANGNLQHCSSICNLFTYNHGQEFKAAAAGAEVRQLGPPPSASALLEALAPWQPRSGKAIERLGLEHLSDVTREALEWLPVNIRSLQLSPASPLPSNPLARGPPQPSPLPKPLAQLSSTCLVQLLWAFASHQHCQVALLRAAAPVLSARILQGQLCSRRVACVAWAYARLQQLEPRLDSAILRTGGRLECGAGSWRAAVQIVYLQP
ncbi:hypothetical protein QJQ45_007576 [Haematococcus lacustris]|nr:hypothetical protein QJQ45_007576 [Haematococcus lacustris]